MHYLIYHLEEASGHVEMLRTSELDATEQAAYAKQGERYLLIRTLLKRELARLCGMAAGEIRFTYTENGKPEFAAQPFNISHSGGLLCMAFHHRAVGVDVERVRERAQIEGLARRIMCTAQREAWEKRGRGVEEFFACWCAAEALTKHCGGTLWQAQQRPFLWQPGGRIETLYEGAPKVELFAPAAGYQGAVAYD